MTIDEIIAEINNMRKFNYTLAPDEVFEMAIKALEQYGVLQEIRDEMNILDDKGEFNISGALKIIDKHISKYEDTL